MMMVTTVETMITQLQNRERRREDPGSHVQMRLSQNQVEVSDLFFLESSLWACG